MWGNNCVEKLPTLGDYKLHFFHSIVMDAPRYVQIHATLLRVHLIMHDQRYLFYKPRPLDRREVVVSTY